MYAPCTTFHRLVDPEARTGGRRDRHLASPRSIRYEASDMYMQPAIAYAYMHATAPSQEAPSEIFLDGKKQCDAITRYAICAVGRMHISYIN